MPRAKSKILMISFDTTDNIVGLFGAVIKPEGDILAGGAK